MYQIFQECSKHSIKCTKCTITFQTTFFLKQNYRLTIIHSQTLQLSCNSFKLSQESCYPYQLPIYRLSRHLNFPHIIQALIPYHTKNFTQLSNICTPYPKCIYICFSSYILYSKQKSALKLFKYPLFIYQ